MGITKMAPKIQEIWEKAFIDEHVEVKPRQMKVKAGQWSNLWNGHADRLKERNPIFISVSGLTFNNHKYVWGGDTEVDGIETMHYAHVGAKYKDILVRKAVDRTFVVLNEVVTNQELGVVAVKWRWAMSGNHVLSKFYFAHEPWALLRSQHDILYACIFDVFISQLMT